MKEKPILEISNVTKIFNQGLNNQVKAIDNINLKVNKGEIVSIMGPSGSGKTTLLNCISGIDSATSGQIFISGKDIQKMKDKIKTKYRASNMGFIFQTFNLIPVLSAIENVELPLLINGYDNNKAKNKAKKMLETVGLGDRLKHKPNELSGGQRQRVTIARALIHNPEIIWADEPTGNLDTDTANEIMKLIIDLNKKFKETFVVVTHDPEIASKANRILKMRNGKIVN